jgi:signal transduction histidine kinase
VTNDPFKEALTPLNGIAQYRKEHSVGNRVHVKGVVTYQRPGKDIFLQDSTGGLQVKSTQVAQFSPGDTVEAVGFTGVENFLPVLEDAVLQKSTELRTNVTSLSVSVSDLKQGRYHASSIALQGKLIDRWARGPKITADHLLVSAKTTLVLQTTNLVFTAEKETSGDDSFLASIPIGSTVQVSGICLLQSAEDGKIESVQFLLPASDNVHVLAKPSWWTAQHLSIILAITFIIIVVASSWIIMVLQKNSVLRDLIHQRELDQIELQKAHDTLEWRVKERTQQLKFQITARKEAEVQFKAVLTERTRLAAELHDTLGQTLTGISLQLNAAAKLSKQNPETASHHLGLARNMVRTSHVDLQRSIWDLRSRELEQFDLSRALLVSGNQMVDSAGIRFQVETNGSVRPLPEIIEENMLRIGQEAIANAVRHSRADQVNVKLEFNPGHVSLEVRDNGQGFVPENCVGPNDGHFGLLGMSERAKRLGGRISITSAPGIGTTIRFDLPTEQIPIISVPSEQKDHEEVIANQDSPC